MKQLGYLLFFYVIVLAGCNRQSAYERLLVEADSLMEQHTDSALHVLESIPDIMDKGDESSRAYYTLLLTQARYKCYQPVPADSLMRSAVRYYEQNGNPSLLCRAYYYLAMPLYEQGEHEEALLLLKKGEEHAVRNQDLLYMAKYHESLCMVNDRAKCYDLMLKYAEQTFSDAVLLNDTAIIARSLSYVSIAYYRLGQRERARDRILESLSHINNMDDEGKAYILTNVGSLSYQFGDNNIAKEYLLESIEIYPMPHTYAELGNIYADEGNKKEAEKCWQEALKTSDSQTILNVLPSIQKRYEQQEDYKSAINISNRIYRIKDSLNQVSEQATIAEIQHKYDHQVVENKYYKTLTWLFGSILLLVSISIGYYFYHRRTVRRYTSQISANEEAIRNAQQRITSLESMDGEHHEEIMALNAQIKMIRQQTNEQLGRGKEVYDSITEGQKLQSVHDEHCLIEYYSVLRYETYDAWMNEYQDLTSRLLTYLILKDMNKSDAEIQETLSITNSSLRSIKTRLKAHLRHS
ncbi:lipopolysaccharide assembly protein LapB [Prevotella sp. tf2-5]|uniref:tetratricopeptide repeat protein n=1 Tax=Prevotella sp. tf2-5 TaxID=1761889 RepID=UPI000B89AA7D|nr:tetratricopeptide repeat protein [Prevotella sp. tf2-5]